MSESRQELLAWLNDLLQLDITKIESCGTGAAYCQIFDTIFLEEVRMEKVKFNTHTEYGYMSNFRELQLIFNKHKVDKIINVTALIKCRMQDNLEFLQWAKKFWDKHADPRANYDPLERRKGVTVSKSAALIKSARTIGPASTVTSAAMTALKQENKALTQNVVGLERERDFYFGKLRDIELLLQQAVEADPEIEKQEDGLIKHVQNVLYSTEDGFEIPAVNENEDGNENLAGEIPDDQETF